MIRHPVFPQDPVPQGPISAEVAVSGAGPAALSVCLALAGHGRQVLLVPPVPWAESPAALGPGVALPIPGRACADPGSGLGRPVARNWRALASRGAEELRARLAGSGAGLERGGLLLLAADATESREMVEGLADLVEDGFPGRMMGPSAATGYLPVETEYPALYLGGAATFEPLAALAALAGQARVAGVRILPPCSGLEWRSTGTGAILEGPGLEVRCRALYLAEGAPVGSSAPWLSEATRQMRVTEPLRGSFTNFTVAVSVDRGGEVYRSGPGGGLLACIAAEDPEVRLRRRFPETRRAAIPTQWAQAVQVACDGLPVAGAWPGHGGIHLLGGFGAAEWSLAWAAAEALVLEPETLAWASPERFG